jgi:hypothetical protein
MLQFCDFVLQFCNGQPVWSLVIIAVMLFVVYVIIAAIDDNKGGCCAATILAVILLIIFVLGFRGNRLTASIPKPTAIETQQVVPMPVVTEKDKARLKPAPEIWREWEELRNSSEEKIISRVKNDPPPKKTDTEPSKLDKNPEPPKFDKIKDEQSNEPFRQWKTTDGVQLVRQFIKLDDGVVYWRSPTQELGNFPFAKLSSEDQRYIRAKTANN